MVNRLIVELNEELEHRVGASEPIRLLLHVRPGTGKSYCLRRLGSLFEEVMNFQKGVHFLITALMATMAAEINGDTIHHALGIAIHQATSDIDCNLDNLSKLLCLLEWMVVDEISNIDARFLATSIDTRLRAAIRASGTRKTSGALNDRPFGGVNMILAGDFWQLPPRLVVVYNCAVSQANTSTRSSPIQMLTTAWISRGRQIPMSDCTSWSNSQSPFGAKTAGTICF